MSINPVNSVILSCRSFNRCTASKTAQVFGGILGTVQRQWAKQLERTRGGGASAKRGTGEQCRQRTNRNWNSFGNSRFCFLARDRLLVWSLTWSYSIT